MSTKYDILYVISLYKTPKPDGSYLTQEEIGRALGCSGTTVSRLLSKEGVSGLSRKGINNAVLSEEQIQDIAKMYTTPNKDGTWNGMKSIAKLFGVSSQTIRHHLVSAGINLRTTKEAFANGKSVKPITRVPPVTESPPICACGCGKQVVFNRRGRGGEWRVFYPGHHHPQKPYQDHDWLRREYVENQRTAPDIANQFRVNHSVIYYWLKKLGIPTRTQPESLKLTGGVRGENNPAWKGGVADWEYSHDWKSIAKKVKDRDEWTCQGCGEKRQRWGTNLHVHHIDEDKCNNHPFNLISLCSKCHSQSHGNSIVRSRLIKIVETKPQITL